MNTPNRHDYYVPRGGLPPQSQRLADRAVFKTAYAFMPAGVQTDIVTSFLPFWEGMRAWTLARPLSGFAETFSHMIVELQPKGGSDRPELDRSAQSVIFVVDGQACLTIDGVQHDLSAGGYAYIPAGSDWTAQNNGAETVTFHWIRKRYQEVEGIEKPSVLVTSDQEIEPIAMPDTGGAWSTTRFIDPSDMRHDMHVNIVTFQPGGVIPFDETHVMEHGLYVLCGKAVYHLNQDWVEVEGGDYMWLRAFCPQACYAAGKAPFRYLLYKDVNRHPLFLHLHHS